MMFYVVLICFDGDFDDVCLLFLWLCQEYFAWSSHAEISTVRFRFSGLRLCRFAMPSSTWNRPCRDLCHWVTQSPPTTQDSKITMTKTNFWSMSWMSCIYLYLALVRHFVSLPALTSSHFVIKPLLWNMKRIVWLHLLGQNMFWIYLNWFAAIT